jgi:hypothetical protein
MHILYNLNPVHELQMHSELRRVPFNKNAMKAKLTFLSLISKWIKIYNDYIVVCL